MIERESLNNHFETVYNHSLIEPEVWIELDDVVGMVPAGITVRSRTEGHRIVWEYLF